MEIDNESLLIQFARKIADEIKDSTREEYGRRVSTYISRSVCLSETYNDFCTALEAAEQERLENFQVIT